MGFMVGFIVIVAIVFAIQKKQQYHHSYGSGPTSFATPTTTSTTNDGKMSLLDQKWGDFDGHATITNQYKVLQRFAHDTTSFTQGLQWHNDRLIESTGMKGESQVRVYDPRRGSTMEQVVDVQEDYFAEGLCWFQNTEGQDRYIQLTWMEQTAFVYDADTLEVVKTFNYTTTSKEGWGITFDPQEEVFYVSDGSDTIHVWNLNFTEIRSFRVSILLMDQKLNSKPYLSLINELEWDPNDQTILANVWFQNAIVKIHPYTGQVLRVFDLSTLYTDRTPDADVMNGIAHYKDNQWWVTGKYWPYLYLVELPN